jgi:hypothetical protein
MNLMNQINNFLYGPSVSVDDIFHHPLADNERLVKDSQGGLHKVKVSTDNNNSGWGKLFSWFQPQVTDKQHLEVVKSIISSYEQEVLKTHLVTPEKLEKIETNCQQLRNLYKGKVSVNDDEKFQSLGRLDRFIETSKEQIQTQRFAESENTLMQLSQHVNESLANLFTPDLPSYPNRALETQELLKKEIGQLEQAITELLTNGSVNPPSALSHYHFLQSISEDVSKQIDSFQNILTKMNDYQWVLSTKEQPNFKVDENLQDRILGLQGQLQYYYNTLSRGVK